MQNDADGLSPLGQFAQVLLSGGPFGGIPPWQPDSDRLSYLILN
jgi:hypothetical protein